MGREFTGESAFVDAYSEYFDVVYREALRYSGNHHVAEEIAQDAFFMAYVQNGNESKQQIKAWMLMLAKYRAMNYIRDHKREVSLEEIRNKVSANSELIYSGNCIRKRPDGIRQ